MLSKRQISLKHYQQKYKKGLEISRGQFGRVYLVENVQQHRPYALKIIKCRSMREREETLCQIQIQITVEHQSVVRIFEYYDLNISNPDRRYECQIGIIMELGHSSLQKCIKDNSYQYSVKQVRTFLARFIQLGAFFQEKGIVHRDIKPANVIIFGEGLNFKLSDFGLSCESNRRPEGYAGTLHYSSPMLKRLYDKKDKKLKPISDPYKDDVYSLGVTVQEVLKKIEKGPEMEGSRSLQNLRKISISELTFLLDEMLKNQQKERPDFLDLIRMDLVQQQLFYDSAKSNTEQELVIVDNSKIQRKTCKKMNQKVYEEQFHTQFKQVRPTYQSLCFNVGNFSVRTLCRINSVYILCGSAEGELFVFNLMTQLTACINFKHDKYVARITADKNGDIWTAGGDGKVYILNKQELIYCIQRQRTVRVQSKSVFGTITLKQQHFVDLSESTVRTVATVPKQNISFIECIDLENYAVGYCDGFVSGKCRGESFLYQTYSEVITSIKFFQGRIFSSGYSGTIKIYNPVTKRLESQIFSFGVPIVDFYYCEERNKIGIISCYGHHESINIVDQYSFNEQLKDKNVIGCAFTSLDGHCYYLTDEGTVYSGDDKIYSCGVKRGWNCLVKQTQDELLMGSFQGQIAIIKIAE